MSVSLLGLSFCLSSNQIVHLFVSLPFPVYAILLYNLTFVRIYLLLKLGVLTDGTILVKLQTTHPVQTLQVQPASPPDTHTVQDEGGS